MLYLIIGFLNFNKKLFDDLHNFFLQVNKVRTDVMRKENPTDTYTYNYFPKDEEPESVIRKGMAQYEDILKIFKRMDKKGGLKLSTETGKLTSNTKTTKAIKKENEQSEKEKEKLPVKKQKASNIDDKKESPKKRKLSDTKQEDSKEKPKKRKISDSNGEEIKEKPKKRKISEASDEPPKKKKISEDSSKKPNIIKRTIGTDNPIVKVKKEDKREEESKEDEKMEKEKEIEIVKENEKEEENNEDNDNFFKEPEEGFVNSQVETTDYEISPDIKLTAKWYYIDKKREKGEDEDDDPEKEEKVHIKISADSKKRLILHWGIYKAMYGLTWYQPPKECYPPGTKEIDKLAVETEFPKNGDRSINIEIQRGKGYKDYIGGINFVIFEPEGNVWYNNYRKDYQIKFKLKVDARISTVCLNISCGAEEAVTDRPRAVR